MHCPLCGHEFDEDHLSCSASCPMAKLQGCHLVCCPNCGYQMVDERKSGLVQMLKRLMGRDPAKPAGGGA